MTVGRFARAQALALRLISKNGEKATLRRRVDGAPLDPARPWDPEDPTYTPVTVNAVFLNFETRRRGGNSTIKARDQKVLIPATDLASLSPQDPNPNTDEIIRNDGTIWSIVEVESLQPNEDRILYTLQARR